jgi:hypothetical protein
MWRRRCITGVWIGPIGVERNAIYSSRVGSCTSSGGRGATLPNRPSSPQHHCEGVRQSNRTTRSSRFHHGLAGPRPRKLRLGAHGRSRNSLRGDRQGSVRNGHSRRSNRDLSIHDLRRPEGLAVSDQLVCRVRHHRRRESSRRTIATSELRSSDQESSLSSSGPCIGGKNCG